MTCATKHCQMLSDSTNTTGRFHRRLDGCHDGWSWIRQQLFWHIVCQGCQSWIIEPESCWVWLKIKNHGMSAKAAKDSNSLTLKNTILLCVMESKPLDYCKIYPKEISWDQETSMCLANELSGTHSTPWCKGWAAHPKDRVVVQV